jgi:hexosaminidase
MELSIVPQPLRIEFKDEWFEIDGFRNAPSFMKTEFEVPNGSWELVETVKTGQGVQVAQGKVTIWGKRFIGYSTALQLLRQKRGMIPEVNIEEKMSFDFRCFHLDIARGGVPNVNAFKNILKWLFLLKYNYFAVYFEDLYPWKTHPNIGKKRGGLSQDEWNTIIAYARKFGIEVIPSLELLGHMEHTLALPEYRKYAELWWLSHRAADGCIDAGSDEARGFTLSLLQDVLETSPCEYVHIGGDETWSLGRGRSLDRTWTYQGPELFLSHYKALLNQVRTHGKKPILWGDMLTGMYLTDKERERWSKVVESELWDDALIANWDYEPSDETHFEQKIDSVGRIHKQVACPSLHNYLTYYPRFDAALKNVTSFLSAAKKKGLKGFMVTAWGDDGSECLYSLLNPLLLASMEAAEGDGNWEKKWLVLSGESEQILKARKLFGEAMVGPEIKNVLYLVRPHFRPEPNKEEIAKTWKTVLEQIKDTGLPADLEFIRNSLRIGLKVLDNTAEASDLMDLAKEYAELWLKERKPNGLENILSRLWGSAAVLDTHPFK